MVDVGPEENRPQGTYHEADGKCRHREHQRREFTARRKIGTADRGTEIAEDHEVVHFQEISARHAENRSYLLLALLGCQHLPSYLYCGAHQITRRPYSECYRPIRGADAAWEARYPLAPADARGTSFQNFDLKPT